jgi:hypothetical protein
MQIVKIKCIKHYWTEDLPLLMLRPQIQQICSKKGGFQNDMQKIENILKNLPHIFKKCVMKRFL